MEVKPEQYHLEVEELEEVQQIWQMLEELEYHPGYKFLRRLADGIVYEAYTMMLKGKNTDLSEVSYWKGVIAGLENLFRNLGDEKEKLKDESEERREEEESDGNEIV